MPPGRMALPAIEAAPPAGLAWDCTALVACLAPSSENTLFFTATLQKVTLTPLAWLQEASSLVQQTKEEDYQVR